MDARASIKADKSKESLKNADKNILGAAAVEMGSRRCGPGTGITSFGDACVSDERALVGVKRCNRLTYSFAAQPSLIAIAWCRRRILAGSGRTALTREL